MYNMNKNQEIKILKSQITETQTDSPTKTVSIKKTINEQKSQVKYHVSLFLMTHFLVEKGEFKPIIISKV